MSTGLYISKDTKIIFLTNYRFFIQKWYNTVMDFKKLSKMVDGNIILDVEHATEKELKVYFDPSDQESFFLIAPEKFKKIEDLTAIINAKAQIKLQTKKNSARSGGQSNS